MRYQLIATATFGLEAVVKREVQNLGYQIEKTEDGKITYQGDERAIVRSNLWLRAADRVLLRVGEFQARTFEELFQQVKGIAWEELLPPDAKFPVAGTSVKSQLHSVPACQSIIQKAVATRLLESYGVDTLPETGAEYAIRFAFLKDRITVAIDTSGAGLHKRGYRVASVSAPIKETLAAAMVQLSFWKPGRYLIDPCCGSGTLCIEAAMIGRNVAPGLSRSFACEGWDWIPQAIWKEERKAAFTAIDYDAPVRIMGCDIDKKAVEAARQNAIEAGVDDCLSFHIRDVAELKAEQTGGIVITNPPYGVRIGDAEGMERIYGIFQKFFRANPTWSLFMITADKTAEKKVYGRTADRRRKLYNGRIEVQYYQFHGKKEE